MNKMNSELEVLKKIWEDNGENYFERSEKQGSCRRRGSFFRASARNQGSRQRRGSYIKLISNQTGFGPDYVRYICNALSKRGEIKPVKKKPGWYRITAKGKKELKLRGIIGAEVSRKITGVKKIVLPLSLKLPKFTLSKSKLVRREEKKLRLGEKIEKAISFLRRV